MSKKFNIHLLARNEDKVTELKKDYQFKSLNWENFKEASQYQVVVNTVGSEETLFNQQFF